MHVAKIETDVNHDSSEWNVPRQLAAGAPAAAAPVRLHARIQSVCH